jgi:hypothetical protein
VSRGAASFIKPEKRAPRKELPGLHPKPEIISNPKTSWKIVQDVRNGTLYTDW